MKVMLNLSMRLKIKMVRSSNRMTVFGGGGGGKGGEGWGGGGGEDPFPVMEARRKTNEYETIFCVSL